MEEDRILVFSGDIHGEFKSLVWKLTQECRIRDADVVICGDCGFGFGSYKYYDELYRKLEPKLEKFDITLWFLRGNHDKLEGYFDGNEEEHPDWPRFKFIQDYKTLDIQGITIYPIGGATSIDIKHRKNYNEMKEKFGSDKRIWWESEKIKKLYKGLPNKVDLIISHQCPLSFEPILVRESWMSDEIYEEVLQERKYLDYVFQNIRCKYWFYGHHHTSLVNSLEGVVYKCLDIMEFYQLQKGALG